MRTITSNKCIVIAFLALSPALIWAHGDAGHKSEMDEEKKVVIPSSSMMTTMIYTKINKTYIKDIKPIFEKKCFDCHADTKNKPWYYNVPGLKQMMDKDIREAKEHIDMRKGFPFISHESPLEDLKSIKKIGLEGGMPPLRYILAHWDSGLTDEEKQKLIEWADKSIELLEVKMIER